MKTYKNSAFLVFFGVSEPPKGTVILTPISKIYKSIGLKYPPIEESQGWWRRMKTKIGSKRVVVLKIPLGSHMTDCLETFNIGEIKKIILLGFCGSLNDKLRVGDIVIPQKEKYKIASVPRMILPKSVLWKLKKRRVDLIDMETALLNGWGKNNNIPVASVLIITDLPRSLPFFSCTKKELQKIDESIKTVTNNLGYYCCK